MKGTKKSIQKKNKIRKPVYIQIYTIHARTHTYGENRFIIVDGGLFSKPPLCSPILQTNGNERNARGSGKKSMKEEYLATAK